MTTVCIAALTLGCCTLLRWYLDRTSRQPTTYWAGRLRVEALWNGGAAFGLPLGRTALVGASLAVLASLWPRRRQSPLGVGLLLGGGVSNLLERLRHGRVLDYLRFPKAPGRMRQYVYNLADLAILLGAIALAWKSRKKRG